MTERTHALLSASSAHRWLHCPPSARASADRDDTAGPAAAQGTTAHAVAEHRLLTALGRACPDPPESQWLDDEMTSHADAYAQWVLDTATEMESPLVLVEERLDYSRWVPDGFGTADCVLLCDGALHVVDYKYGQGVLVAAAENPQMMLYALGAWHTLGLLYDVDTVAMTVYQPRRDNISTATMTLRELLAWADDVVAPTAALADAGDGDYSAGEWCRWCPIKTTCRARAQSNLELARMEFTPAAELTDEEIADVLARLPQLVSWANDVQAFATSAAAEQGRRWPGFKLVEGRSTRRWADPAAVADACAEAGHEAIWDRRLIGITAMQKLLGRDFDDIVGHLIDKPAGKPTLVPETDNRPELVRSDASTEFQPIH